MGCVVKIRRDRNYWTGKKNRLEGQQGTVCHATAQCVRIHLADGEEKTKHSCNVELLKAKCPKVCYKDGKDWVIRCHEHIVHNGIHKFLSKLCEFPLRLFRLTRSRRQTSNPNERLTILVCILSCCSCPLIPPRTCGSCGDILFPTEMSFLHAWSFVSDHGRLVLE